MSEPNHAFWRKLVLPQEERELPWDGKGYRWFKSPNIVPLEQYRERRKAALIEPEVGHTGSDRPPRS
jgi:hypothetical protein